MISDYQDLIWNSPAILLALAVGSLVIPLWLREELLNDKDGAVAYSTVLAPYVLSTLFFTGRCIYLFTTVA
jgi:hypothetical protein